MGLLCRQQLALAWLLLRVAPAAPNPASDAFPEGRCADIDTAAVSMESEHARTWWETEATDKFAHTRKVTQDALRQSVWERTWLTRLHREFPLDGHRVIEYGIGAGGLGILLLDKYHIRHYVGIDIASRQLKAAAVKLKRFGPGKVTLKLAPTNLLPVLSALAADTFVSQAVIQHFPSEHYFRDWILAVGCAQIPTLMLQVRNMNGSVSFMPWADKAPAQVALADVAFANSLTCEYLQRWLDPRGYHLVWQSFRDVEAAENSKYQSCTFRLGNSSAS